MTVRVIVPFLAALLFTLQAVAGARSYWVWHRSEPLTASEVTELAQQQVTTLYWHAGTLAPRGDHWHWSEGPRALAEVAQGLRIVPVVRIESEDHDPFADMAALRAQLARVARAGAVQLDYDCPDRLLPDYAVALGALRTDFPQLSITALAHWPRLKDFHVLARNVSELCPMFYDLQADPRGVSATNPPPPLLDSLQIERALIDWSACPVRWRAGLPAFTRLTRFDSHGISRGQIPDWQWDDVVFHKHLRAIAPTRIGVTLLRADTHTRIAGRALYEGDILAVRMPDPAALAQSLAAAERSGAAGVVLFRLPGRADSASQSLAALRDLGATPKPTLRREGDTFILTNDSDTDIAPRLTGERHDRDRGYALELDAPAPVFREAEPGMFWRVTAHVDADATPRAATVQTATRLSFWLSHLPAGASLRSGIFQLAPGATPLRWRIVPLTDWQPLP